MNVLGLHLLLELKECNPQLLDDLSYVRSSLIRAAEDVGAHIVGESFHRFTPQGVTGILSIAESHISIHTWPEYGYAAADIFTCGDSFQPRQAADALIELFESRDSEVYEFERGRIFQPAAAATGPGGR